MPWFWRSSNNKAASAAAPLPAASQTQEERRLSRGSSLSSSFSFGRRSTTDKEWERESSGIELQPPGHSPSASEASSSWSTRPPVVQGDGSTELSAFHQSQNQEEAVRGEAAPHLLPASSVQRHAIMEEAAMSENDTPTPLPSPGLMYGGVHLPEQKKPGATGNSGSSSSGGASGSSGLMGGLGWNKARNRGNSIVSLKGMSRKKSHSVSSGVQPGQQASEES